MQKTKILKLFVDLTDHGQVLNFIMDSACRKTSKYICVANVHMCMEAFDNPEYAEIVNGADMTVPDGRPLVWAQKLLGHRNAGQVRGSDLMRNVCRQAEKRNISVGFYGGSKQALNGLQGFLKRQFPELSVACAISPPFRKLSRDEDQKDIDIINRSGARILFVGLGCPKQEYWMAAHKGKVNCVMIGIGAAFDFFGGTQKQAPGIMQKTGTEWVFRFASEPGRLWKRYLKHNPRFVYYFFKQLFLR
jgi:N-acetylglucosaminyldiphosphoundecaprenol N-acetyl-beta-D-mannosaminyltransferase